MKLSVCSPLPMETFANPAITESFRRDLQQGPIYLHGSYLTSEEHGGAVGSDAHVYDPDRRLDERLWGANFHPVWSRSKERGCVLGQSLIQAELKCCPVRYALNEASFVIRLLRRF
jgi:hypothetical protein